MSDCCANVSSSGPCTAADQVAQEQRDREAGLASAGLIVQHRRNHYAIPADRVVPVLVAVAAALGR